MVVQVLEHALVGVDGGGFDDGGGDGPCGDSPEERGEGEFLLQVKEDEEDEIHVPACERFVEGDGLLADGEEKRDLLPRSRFVFEELGCERAAAFVESGARDFFE